jgi:4-amino-4-deoxy-L-arabinose transferase-like glycosyltransferase
MSQKDAPGGSESGFYRSLRSISTWLNNKAHWVVIGSIMLFSAIGTVLYFFWNKKKVPSFPDDHYHPSTYNPVLSASPQAAKEILQKGSQEQEQFLQANLLQKANDRPFLTITWPEHTSNPKRMNPPKGWIPSRLWMVRSRKIAFSLAWPLLALLFAYLAQAFLNVSTKEGIKLNWNWLTFLPQNYRIGLAAIIFLISLIIWAFANPPKHNDNQKLGQIEDFPITSLNNNLIRFFLLIGSILVYAVSLIAYIVFNETAFIRILWVISIIFFILSQAPWTGFFRNKHPHSEESPRFQSKHWVIIAIILLIAFWLRFYQLRTLPEDFHGDSGSYGIQAREFLSGTGPNIFNNGWYNIPKIAFLPTAISLSMFGNDMFGLRMTSVVGGLFVVLGIYLLVWRLFNNHRMAAISSSVVAINILQIHFSRIGTGYIDPWSFCLFALFFLIDGLKGRRGGSLAVAGIFLGFGINMYYSGRVAPIIIAAFLLITFFVLRQWISENKKGLVLFALGILVAMGPSLVTDITNWRDYIERTREVSIFEPANIKHLSGKYSVNSLSDIILTQTQLSLEMFNYTSDTSTQFGFPYAMISPFLSPLIILGLGTAIRRWKEPGIYLACIWTVMMVVLGSILTIDSPFWPRLVGIVPAVAILIALTIDQILDLGNQYFHKSILNIKIALIVILFVFVGVTGWSQYTAFARTNGSNIVIIGRYLSKLPPNITLCGLFDPIVPLSVREASFQIWPRNIIDINPGGPDSDLTACTGSSIVWAISPENKNRLQAIKTLWPNGVEQESTNHNQYVVTYYFVGVPIPQDSVPNTVLISTPYSRIFSLIFDGIAIAGVLIWVILISVKKTQTFYALAHLIKMIPPMPIIRINWDVIHPKQYIRKTLYSLKSSWHDFVFTTDNWYQDLLKFDLSSYTRKQIISIAVAVLLPLFVVCLAYFGQIIIDQWKVDQPVAFMVWVKSISEDQHLAIGGGIFLISAVLWGLITTHKKSGLSVINDLKQRVSATELNPLKSTTILKNTSSNSGRLVRYTGLFCTIGSMALYMVYGENGFIRWLWLIGVGLFLLSLFGKKRIDKQYLDEESPSFKWYHLVFLCGLLGVAFYLRVYRLSDIPLELSTDMASIGVGAREYMLGLEQRFFGLGWFYMPRLSFIPYVVSIKYLGNNLFGLYFPAVIMGTFNILACYLFIWRLFDQHRLAILTAIIMTISPGHINYSRIISFMDPWFFGFFALYFLIDGLKGRRKISLSIAGVLTGITLILYPSGRAIIPIIAIIIGVIWLFKRQLIIDNRDGFWGMGLGALVILGPNLVFMITNWSNYMARTNEVIIFNPEVIRHLKTVFNVDNFGMIVWEQIKHTVFLFNYYPDLSAQSNYPHPMYNSLISPMLILGLGSTIFKWKKPEYLITLACFAFILVTGSVMTVNAPTWSRLVGIIPFSALIIAFAFNEFFNIFDRISWKVLTPFLWLAILMLFALLGTADWNIFTQEMKHERPVVQVSRYLATLPTDVNACGITEGFDLKWPEVNFLAWPRNTVVIPQDIIKITADSCPGSKIVWILTPASSNRINEIENEWPGGILQEHRLENGDLIFASYLVYGKPNP